MSILLVTYDLRQPGRDYRPVHEWLSRFTHCKGLESVWLLDTTWSPAQVRDVLMKLVDGNDRLFVCMLQRSWASLRYDCGDWLNDPARNW